MNGGLIKFETPEERRKRYLKEKGNNNPVEKSKQMCKVRQSKYQFYG